MLEKKERIPIHCNIYVRGYVSGKVVRNGHGSCKKAFLVLNSDQPLWSELNIY
ncbi:MAG: hypothetical protein ACI8RD_008614 [Bacillariaceae sp.]|jgi:hypothetical protein